MGSIAEAMISPRRVRNNTGTKPSAVGLLILTLTPLCALASTTEPGFAASTINVGISHALRSSSVKSGLVAVSVLAMIGGFRAPSTSTSIDNSDGTATSRGGAETCSFFASLDSLALEHAASAIANSHRVMWVV